LVNGLKTNLFYGFGVNISIVFQAYDYCGNGFYCNGMLTKSVCSKYKRRALLNNTENTLL